MALAPARPNGTGFAASETSATTAELPSKGGRRRTKDGDVHGPLAVLQAERDVARLLTTLAEAQDTKDWRWSTWRPS